MDLRQAEIGLLIALDSLLEHESVTTAAKQIGVSQPAMSAQLARLRHLFRDPLLTPSGRRLVPTTRALELKAPLRHLLGELDGLVREHRFFQPEQTDTIFRLVGTDYVHAVIAPSLVVSLAEQAPGARLALLPFQPTALWQSLERDHVDMALAVGMELPDARAQVVLSEDFVAIQRRGHPRGQVPFSIDSFCAAEHILISPEGGGFTGAIDKSLKQLGQRRHVRCSLPSFLVAPAMVAQSDLVCVLARRLAARYADTVDTFELPFESPEFQVRLMWHPRRQADPAHIWFRRLINETIRAL